MLIRGQCHCGNIAFEFGTRTATFHICAHCGAVPLVISEIAQRLYAVVNVNVLENVDLAWLRRSAANFEGEDVDSRLVRRARNWIADVRITEGVCSVPQSRLRP
jgi:hypothetical protein